MSDLNQAAKLLWEPIPEPPPKRIKAAATWHQLKAGQHLALRHPVRLTDLYLKVGTVVKVVGVDSASALLAPIDNPTQQFLWTNPTWRDQFERVRKRKSTT